MPWTLIAALVTVLLTPVVANLVASTWQDARKLRELDMQALEELYSLYGEFIAIWKESRRCQDAERASQLHGRACAVEGRLEALLVRVAAERPLYPKDVQQLGALRQVFQRLRESLQPDSHKDGQAVQTWKTATAPGYVALKALTTNVAGLLAAPRPRQRRFWPGPSRPSEDQAAFALLRITSNRLEYPTWVSVGLCAPGVSAYLRDLEPDVRDACGKVGSAAHAEFYLLKLGREEYAPLEPAENP
jgi:hypothetical protein